MANNTNARNNRAQQMNTVADAIGRDNATKIVAAAHMVAPWSTTPKADSYMEGLRRQSEQPAKPVARVVATKPVEVRMEKPTVFCLGATRSIPSARGLARHAIRTDDKEVAVSALLGLDGDLIIMGLARYAKRFGKTFLDYQDKELSGAQCLQVLKGIEEVL